MRSVVGFGVLLWFWTLCAVAMLALIAAMILLPEAARPVERWIPHRDNLSALEWKAAEQVERLVPAGEAVAVETDNPIFLYLVRHRLYPAWVVPVDREDVLAAAPPGSLLYHAVFRTGSLHVAERKR
ncbi:MAG: hypothetical protein GF346_03510 [Candidatus Eisenbacteria bacterium]|nr:hypothetical protein [Candidatus Latescibacterota bacterium]MBD3301490.1 hypothetical protein [Candidatus Eisenbacteria bacterium]